MVNGSSAWSNSIFDGYMSLGNDLSGPWSLAFYDSRDKEINEDYVMWAGTASGQTTSSCVDSFNNPAPANSFCYDITLSVLSYSTGQDVSDDAYGIPLSCLVDTSATTSNLSCTFVNSAGTVLSLLWEHQ